MEKLLVEMNQTLEGFVAAVLLASSAKHRFKEHVQRGSTEQEVEKWRKEVGNWIDAFNAAERMWLVTSRVILGNIRLYFYGVKRQFEQVWEEIIHESERTCTLFNTPEVTHQQIWDYMLELRNKKNQLIDFLQEEIDLFVSTELEPSRKAR